MLAALALGDRSRVDPRTVQLLRATGTSHLLAISGFHVSVVAMLAVHAGGWVRRAGGLWRPGGLRSWEWLGGVALAFAYTLAADAPISAQRASGLLALGAVGRWFGRRAEVEPLLGVVAVGVLLVDPGAVDSPSFQLSFGAILGLIRVAGPLQAALPQGRIVGWLSGGVAATVGATVGTLPSAAWWFQELAPLSPLANLFALPLTSIVLVPAAAVASFGPEPLAGWADAVGTLGARVLIAGLSPLAVDPWRPAVGPAGALLLVVALGRAHRPPRAALLALVAFGLRPLPRTETITFLAVGQGDATLVERADGRRELIDGGPKVQAVAAYLRRRGLRRIDVVVATHNQADHVAGLVGVVGTLRVGRLEVSDHEALGGLKAAAERRGVPIEAAMGLHPAPSFVGSPNDRSVVRAVWPALLTGDIEAAGEAAVAARVGRYPVLKVPHHGSTTSSSPALLDAVQPSLAIVSVGPDNRWGHPREEVLTRYAERGARVLRTDQHGTVELRRGALRGHLPGRGWASLGAVDLAP